MSLLVRDILHILSLSRFRNRQVLAAVNANLCVYWYRGCTYASRISLIKFKVEFCFGGSTLLSNRSLLSLVAALFLSTLASADSIPVNLTFLHSVSVYAGASSYPAPLSISGIGKATPALFGTFNNRAAEEHVNAQLSGLPSGHVTDNQTRRLTSARTSYGTIDRKESHWVLRSTTAMSTPEPASLLLLSSGLMGIAGMVRHKLLRG